MIAEPSKSVDTSLVAGLLVGGGVLGSLYLLVKRSKSIFTWVIPVGMIAVGVDLLLKERHKRIVQTGDQILAQLDELDPIAKAEVVKYVADKEVEELTNKPDLHRKKGALR
jgi:hypothetical protein